jgi:hypothetical protein
MGATHVHLANVGEELLHGALETAWRSRREKNAGTKAKGTGNGRRGRKRSSIS